MLLLPAAFQASVAAVRTALHLPVRHIARADYLLHGQEDAQHLGPVEFGFADGTCLQLDILSDAESTVASREPIPHLYAPPRPDCWHRIVLTSRPGWRALVGHAITHATALVDGDEDRRWISGWRLFFTNGRSVCYFNSADDAQAWFDRVPDFVGREHALATLLCHRP